MFRHLLATPLATAAACLVAATSAQAVQQTYHVTPLLPAGATVAYFNAIAGDGHAVGWAGTVGATQAVVLGADGVATMLGTLGGTSSSAMALNGRGKVVGASTTASADYHAFAWTERRMHDLGVLSTQPHASSSANAINKTGLIVGEASADDGATHAVRWVNGHIADLGTLPGTTDSEAITIDDAGTIVGNSHTYFGAAARSRCFSWQSGAMTDLGSLGGPDGMCEAHGGNDRGQVVGSSSLQPYYGPGLPTRAFLFDHGTMKDLGLPRTTDGGADASAINRKGVVVGSSYGQWGTADRSAFVYDGETIVELATRVDASGAGWTFAYATAINADGVIIGQGYYQGVWMAWKATPVVQ